MLSFHAASIIASWVRTEYPAQSEAQDIPKRSPRITLPDSENKVDRLRRGTSLLPPLWPPFGTVPLILPGSVWPLTTRDALVDQDFNLNPAVLGSSCFSLIRCR